MSISVLKKAIALDCQHDPAGGKVKNSGNMKKKKNSPRLLEEYIKKTKANSSEKVVEQLLKISDKRKFYMKKDDINKILKHNKNYRKRKQKSKKKNEDQSTAFTEEDFKNFAKFLTDKK